jgi:hypothetical protein
MDGTGLGSANRSRRRGAGIPGRAPGRPRPARPPEPDPDPPELPYPSTKTESVEWTKANAVYDQSVPSPTNCPLTPVKSAGASAAELEVQLAQVR